MAAIIVRLGSIVPRISLAPRQLAPKKRSFVKRQSSSAADPHQDSAAHLARKDLGSGLGNLCEGHFGGYRRKLLAVKVGGEPPPGLAAERLRAIHRIDPEERNAAQDERGDGSRQIQTLRETAGGDRTAIFRHRQQIGERVRTRRIDTPAPALLAERLRGAREFGAVDNLGST